MKSQNLTMKKYSTCVDRETQHCQVSVLPKLTCGLSAISAKIQANFFVYAKKKKKEGEQEGDSKVYMEWKKKSSLANTILKNNFVGLML